MSRTWDFIRGVVDRIATPFAGEKTYVVIDREEPDPDPILWGIVAKSRFRFARALDRHAHYCAYAVYDVLSGNPYGLDPEQMNIIPYNYELLPLLKHGSLMKFEQFQELVKIYSMDSDNGTGYWASANGLWLDKRTKTWSQVDTPEIRASGRPQVFFTHVLYFGK